MYFEGRHPASSWPYAKRPDEQYTCAIELLSTVSRAASSETRDKREKLVRCEGRESAWWYDRVV